MRHLSATMRAKHTLWMCVALAAAILAAFLVVVLGTPTKPAEAAFPGNNGKIAFMRHDGDDWEIWTMNAKGDNKTQLTDNQVFEFNPVFSANGKKIAFAREEQPNDNSAIYTMSANGTDKKRVTRSESGDDDLPSWSPDGTKIAFARGPLPGNTDIYVINQDGTGLTRLTTSPKRDTQPAWSPDGTRIAFRRGNKIQVMKAARESQTNRPKRLTTSAFNVSESDPAWSPDGTRIAFASKLMPTGNLDLYSIRADGSDQIRLTTTSKGQGREPAWSPDGTKIAFRGPSQAANTYGIFVMEAKPESETNRPKRLTGLNSDFAPDWQPLR